MAGTKEGGLAAAATNKARYGGDFYKNIGKAGGSVPHRETRPFYVDRQLASLAGGRGGKISRRPKSVRFEEPKVEPSLLQRLLMILSGRRANGK